LSGVKGIASSGAEVPEANFSYEICFKCHGDKNFVGIAKIARQHPQLNTRLEFDVTSASYHPVEAIGKNTVVPSLISPLTVNSILYCTDCHNSDDSPQVGGSGLDGPHGISSTQGNEINNSHLINFDINIVFPNQLGALMFEDLGTLTGACPLTCHGKEHDNEVYP
jgi:hypothetical protein